MKRFIFQVRNGLHIIDLAKTLQQLHHCIEVISDTIAHHRTILFVGTKKQAKSVIKECAEACGEFYVCERWLGGMLTNLSTIRQSIRKLEKIEKSIEAGGEGLKKKELSNLNKDRIKLERNLDGIRSMRKPPGLIIVVDPNQEHLAVAEARKLNIPVMALVDTNCDPDLITHIIACNDDALKSIRTVLQTLAQAAIDKKREMHLEVTDAKGDGAENPEELKAEEEARREKRARVLAAKLGTGEEEG